MPCKETISKEMAEKLEEPDAVSYRWERRSCRIVVGDNAGLNGERNPISIVEKDLSVDSVLEDVKGEPKK